MKLVQKIVITEKKPPDSQKKVNDFLYTLGIVYFEFNIDTYTNSTFEYKTDRKNISNVQQQ